MKFYVQYVALYALLLGMPTMFLGFNKVVLIVEFREESHFVVTKHQIYSYCT